MQAHLPRHFLHLPALLGIIMIETMERTLERWDDGTME
jgi:hypothetical protein